jgi:excisionase family DNA binding protein
MTHNSTYVTVREASQMLGISEGKIMSMVDERKLMAYRIADQYLRLKRVDVEQLKSSGNVISENVKFPYTPQERLKDFFLYNDFYIASAVVIAILLAVVFLSR